MQHATFKLVEESAGTGELLENGVVLGAVRYTIARYQGMLYGSGMPVPGLHRIEGSVDYPIGDGNLRLVGALLTLRLEDGRALGVTIADREGRLLAEGHGPCGGCSCC